MSVLRAAGLRLGVDTSATRSHADRSLARLGLGTVLEATVSGDDVARAQPAPDSFLACAARLGIATAQIAAVEDSPKGASAARSAGMLVAGVRRGAQHVLTGAHHVADDVLGAAQWLASHAPTATPGRR